MSSTAHSRESSENKSNSQYRLLGTKQIMRVKAGPNLGQRDRSVPYKRPFIIAVLSMLMFYLAVIGLVTAVAVFAFLSREYQHRAAYVIATLLGASVFFWIYAYLMRRKANCPLCKCTPLLDNLALKHQKAKKVWPFNYGNTAVLGILINQRWRCMYCGTPFDILKSKLKD